MLGHAGLGRDGRGRAGLGRAGPCCARPCWVMLGWIVLSGMSRAVMGLARRNMHGGYYSHVPLKLATLPSPRMRT